MPAVASADERVLPESRIESARGVALGTGVRASALSTQAQADNVANLARGGLYHIETFVGYQPTFKRVGWGAAVVDSMTSQLAAGFSARGLFGENDAGENSGWEGRLALSVPFAEAFSVGVAGRYMRLEVADDRTPAPTGTAGMTVVPDQQVRVEGFTMDAAMTLQLFDSFSIAALGMNLIDKESPLAPLTVGGSAAYGTGSGLTVGADVLVDLNTHDQFDGPSITAGGGLEYLFSGVFPLRGGYIYDEGRKQSAVTGGAGFVDQQFGIQFGLRQVVSGGKETTTFLSLQYFVQ